MFMSVPWLNYPLTIEALTGGGGGGGRNKLACSLKSTICFPGFHVPQHFLCLLVRLKSCTYLLCSLEINTPLPCSPKPMEGLTNYLPTPPPSILLLFYYVFFFPSCYPIYLFFAGLILDGPNPFCEKILLLMALTFGLAPYISYSNFMSILL